MARYSLCVLLAIVFAIDNAYGYRCAGTYNSSINHSESINCDSFHKYCCYNPSGEPFCCPHDNGNYYMKVFMVALGVFAIIAFFICVYFCCLPHRSQRGTVSGRDPTPVPVAVNMPPAYSPQYPVQQFQTHAPIYVMPQPGYEQHYQMQQPYGMPPAQATAPKAPSYEDVYS